MTDRQCIRRCAAVLLDAMHNAPDFVSVLQIAAVTKALTDQVSERADDQLDAVNAACEILAGDGRQYTQGQRNAIISHLRKMVEP